MIELNSHLESILNFPLEHSILLCMMWLFPFSQALSEALRMEEGPALVLRIGAFEFPFAPDESTEITAICSFRLDCF